MRITDNVYMLSGTPYGQSGNVYGINCGEGLVLIDTGRDRAAVSTILENIEYHGLSRLPVTHVLITHMHDDHMGNAWYFSENGSGIYCSEPDASGMEEGGLRVNDFGFAPVCTCKVDRRLKDKEEFRIGNVDFRIVYVPGHTNGSAFYLFSVDGKTFGATGDAVFPASGPFGGKLDAALGWMGSLELDKKLYTESLKNALDLRFDVLLGGHGFPAMKDGWHLIGMAYRKTLMEFR